MPPRKKTDSGVTDYIATGTIQHGQKGVDYEEVGGAEWFHEGDAIPDGVFTPDELQALIDVGAVVHRDEVGGGMLDSQIEAARADFQAREAAMAEREKDLEERERQIAAAEKAASSGGAAASDKPVG